MPNLGNPTEHPVEASVVIPTYNRRDRLRGTLTALDAQTGDTSFEVIVSDDGSTDGTLRMLERLAPRLRYAIRWTRTERAGPGAARNAAIRCVRGKVVLFTDSDCVPGPGWVQSMVGCLRTEVDAVGGPVTASAGSGWFAVAVNRIMHTWLGGMGRRWRLWGLVPGYRLRTGNCGITRDALDAHGGFSEAIGHYGEDAEWSERLIQSGVAVSHVKEAMVAHHECRSPSDYCLEAYAKGLTTARFLRGGLLPLRCIYLLPAILLIGALATPPLLMSAGAVGLVCAPWALYGSVLIGFGVDLAVRSRRALPLAVLPVAALLMHLAWGAGLVSGALVCPRLHKGPDRPRFVPASGL